jgi:hypothetical protein
VVRQKSSLPLIRLGSTALVVAVISVATMFTMASALDRAKMSSLSLTNLESEITKSAKIKVLPNLVVPLTKMSQDSASDLSKGCLIAETATTPYGNRPATCYFGDTHVNKTMVLFGDSNAWMWLPTFNTIGLADHFRVEFDARAGCEIADLDLSDNSTLGSAEACTTFRGDEFTRIKALAPFLTVAVDYEYTNHVNYTNQAYTQSAYDAGLTQTLSTIASDKSKIVLLSPPPPQLSDPIECLSINTSNIENCNVSTLCLNGNNYQNAECQYHGENASIKNIIGLATAVKNGKGTYISLQKLFCTSSTCPIVVDKTVVMFDQLHVSDHYANLVELAMTKLFPKGDL